MRTSSKLELIFSKLLSFYGPQNWWPYHTKVKDKLLEISLGAILTQNTSWRNVEKALANLISAQKLDFSSLYHLNRRRLAQLIRPAGFFNQKAIYLKNFINYVYHNYHGRLRQWFNKDLSKLRSELLAIKGIGPETADSILLYAAQKPIFVVDAYTKRIFSRIGLIDSRASYTRIQKLVHDNLKRETKLYQEFHALLVKQAKTFCLKDPLCFKCPLRKYCFYYSKK
jgi:endonuclease-3 related protein